MGAWLLALPWPRDPLIPHASFSHAASLRISPFLLRPAVQVSSLSDLVSGMFKLV